MSFLVGGSWDSRSVRGPFGLTENPATPSNFVPSGAEWVAAQAVYTARGATGYIWKADPASLRISGNNADGVAAGNLIGYANDWLDPGNNARAAIESGARRPTYAVVAGVPALVFTGDQTTTDNQRLATPVINPTQGTWIFLSYMADAANANQTVAEFGPFRFMAQQSGSTGPQVRTGGNTLTNFGLSSMLERWSCFIVQANKVTNQLRLLYDAGAWVTASISDWLEAPADGYEFENYINRNYFDGSAPFGAPMNGATNCVIYIDQFDSLTQADLQYLVDLAVRDSAVFFEVPELPGTAQSLVARVNSGVTAALATQTTASATWVNGAPAAGDLMIAQVGHRSAIGTAPAMPEGWTLGVVETSELADSDWQQAMWTFYKIASAGESAGVTATWGASVVGYVALSAFRAETGYEFGAFIGASADSTGAANGLSGTGSVGPLTVERALVVSGFQARLPNVDEPLGDASMRPSPETVSNTLAFQANHLGGYAIAGAYGGHRIVLEGEIVEEDAYWT